MRRMVHSALYTSRAEDWETPQALFDALHHVFAFALDACAHAGNSKLERFFSPDEDGLSQDWASHGRIWLNPPYGRAIGQWMAKAHAESQKGCLVVALVPARTDTRWWHQSVTGKASVTFLRGRLSFSRAGAPAAAAPFPSAIVVYGPRLDALLDRPHLRGRTPARLNAAGAEPRVARRPGRALRRGLRGRA